MRGKPKKHCPRCGDRKTLVKYFPDPPTEDGLSELCKECYRWIYRHRLADSIRRVIFDMYGRDKTPCLVCGSKLAIDRWAKGETLCSPCVAAKVASK